jgi:superfamily I DNA and RNA helicase
MNGNCINCVLVNEQYHEESVELKSLHLINKMLQEGIKSLRSQEEEIKVSRKSCTAHLRERKQGVYSVQVM